MGHIKEFDLGWKFHYDMAVKQYYLAEYEAAISGFDKVSLSEYLVLLALLI